MISEINKSDDKVLLDTNDAMLKSKGYLLIYVDQAGDPNAILNAKGLNFCEAKGFLNYAVEVSAGFESGNFGESIVEEDPEDEVEEI